MDLIPQIRSRGMVVVFLICLQMLMSSERHCNSLDSGNKRVVVFHVMDRDEIEFPFEDNTRFLGLESSDEVHADPRL